MTATATDARAFRLPFAVVATGVFLAVLDLFIVNVAFPTIGADFDGTSSPACPGSSTPTRSSSPPC